MKKILFFMLLVVYGALASSCDELKENAYADCVLNEIADPARQKLKACHGKVESVTKAYGDVSGKYLSEACRKDVLDRVKVALQKMADKVEKRHLDLKSKH
jgi:hypothetical protein